ASRSATFPSMRRWARARPWCTSRGFRRRRSRSGSRACPPRPIPETCMRSCRSPDERSEIRVFTSPRLGEVGGPRPPAAGVPEFANKDARWNPLTPTLSPPGRGRASLAALALLVVCAVTPAHAADDLAVDVINASVPTLCAEKDNVTLNLVSPTVRRFTVEAVHPAYIGSISNDRAAPDFAHCDFAAAALAPAPARRITIFETED